MLTSVSTPAFFSCRVLNRDFSGITPLVDNHDPRRINMNPMIIAALSGSLRRVTPRKTETAGFTYVMTVPLLAPTSAMSAKKSDRPQLYRSSRV